MADTDDWLRTRLDRHNRQVRLLARPLAEILELAEEGLLLRKLREQHPEGVLAWSTKNQHTTAWSDDHDPLRRTSSAVGARGIGVEALRELVRKGPTVP